MSQREPAAESRPISSPQNRPVRQELEQRMAALERATQERVKPSPYDCVHKIEADYYYYY
jgi:hypothetical protein